MKGKGEKETDPGGHEKELSIEVTTYCNLACMHCFARAGTSEPSRLPLDLVKEIIAEGYGSGYRRLHITGGEPLLWEGLSVALDYGLAIGYETITMNTNGTLLTEVISSRLAAYDGLLISVSLEGSEALHKRLRGEGSYKRTIRGIEKALDAGIGLVIFTTAWKGLLPKLPHFADDLYRRYSTIKCLTLIPLFNVTDGFFALSDELLAPADFVRLVKTVSLLNLWGHKTNVLNDPLVNIVSKLLEMPWIPRAPPLNREGSIIVMANGSISLSHSSRDSFGKYKPGMIGKVLSSDEYQKAVAPDEETCPTCKYAEPCMENGMVRPAERDGKVHHKVPYCRSVLDRVAAWRWR
ncbi:MAG: radical SAM protein [Desulfobacteraceae bacterium]|nr:MAG: radical SAM protein [Desulfobacteraceae bacterium]